jgi:dsRNA-specific ribonuclease
MESSIAHMWKLFLPNWKPRSGAWLCRPELLVRALTHRSLANERAASEQVLNEQIFASDMEEAAEAGDNERLEFLGDAVLGLVVAEALFLLHPEWQEGELTRVRSQLVSRQHMAEVAAAIGLGGHLRLSRGEDKSGLGARAPCSRIPWRPCWARSSWTAAWSRCEPLSAAG